jgi:RNA polymerase sigma factor (sigma-70 family)
VNDSLLCRVNVSLQLIEKCLQGDQRAYSELYRACYPFMISVTARYIRQREQAVELVNTAFISMVNGLHQYNSAYPFGAWLRRIVINTILNEYRKNNRLKSKVTFIDQEELSRINVGDQADLSEFDTDRITLVTKCIQLLPPMTGQVFNLFMIDGYSHKEISSMLHISEGTSAWHVNEGKQRIKALIEKQNSDNK